MTTGEVYFSIVIPTYNRGELVVKTIESVLSQHYKGFEVIVIDDGSTDGTTALLKSQFNNQIRLFRIENSERGAARNYGASEAEGDYIYFLDSDDLLYTLHLEKAANFLKLHSNPPWFFQEYEIIDDKRRTRIDYNRKYPLKSLLTQGNFLSCHGVFIRRDFFEEHRFNENRILAGSEDYELWIRLAAEHILLINPVLTSALVQHDDRSVFNFSLDKLIQRKELMLRLLLENDRVQDRFRSYFPKLRSHTYSYIALHAAMIGAKKSAIKYWWKGIQAAPESFIKKRNFAILKHLLLQ